MKLIDIAKNFSNEEACLAYLEIMRWPEGVECVECGSKRISKFSTKEGTRKKKNAETGEVETKIVPVRHLYQCLACKKQFAATTGTIFHNTHFPAHKWFMAVALMIDAKKGISALQMQRRLTENEGTADEKKPAYKTVWFLCHRIRKAMEQDNPGRVTTVAEIDETYVGGKYDKRRKRGPWDKAPVVGVLQRKTDERCSQVRAMHVPNVGGKTLVGIVKDSVSPKAELVCTDEATGYTKLGALGYKHETVTHIKLEYVRQGDKRIHTNGIENFRSLFKRGVIGSYHQVSVRHLRALPG
jgi:DNA-directed RNA polymerase subunit RPC12/RpoP